MHTSNTLGNIPLCQTIYENGKIDASVVEATVKSIATAASLANASCLVADFDKKRIIFRSDTLLYINETISTDILWKCDNSYWSLIPKDVRSKLARLKDNYLRFSRTLNRKDGDSHIITSDYPIMVNGKLLYVNQRFSPLVANSGGRVRVGVFFFYLSSRKCTDCFIIAKSGKRWRYNFQREAFDEFVLQKPITERERIILQRARIGMSMNEISANMNISVPTVKTHINHVLRKLGVGSLEEAYTIIKNYQLI